MPKPIEFAALNAEKCLQEVRVAFDFLWLKCSVSTANTPLSEWKDYDELE